MDTTIRGYIPVREKTLRFIEWSENLKFGDPLRLPGKSPVCVFLQSQIVLGLRFLDAPRKSTEIPYRESTEKFGHRLNLELSGHLATHDIFAILSEVAFSFDVFIPALMNQEVFSRVQMGYEFGLSEQLVIEEFLDELNLSEIIEMDSFKKDQYRFRKARRIPPYISKRGRRVIRNSR